MQCQITVISAGSSTRSFRIHKVNPGLLTMLHRALSFSRPFGLSDDKPSGTSPSGPLQPPGLTIWLLREWKAYVNLCRFVSAFCLLGQPFKDLSGRLSGRMIQQTWSTVSCLTSDDPPPLGIPLWRPVRSPSPTRSAVPKHEHLSSRSGSLHRADLQAALYLSPGIFKNMPYDLFKQNNDAFYIHNNSTGDFNNLLII